MAGWLPKSTTRPGPSRSDAPRRPPPSRPAPGRVRVPEHPGCRACERPLQENLHDGLCASCAGRHERCVRCGGWLLDRFWRYPRGSFCADCRPCPVCLRPGLAPEDDGCDDCAVTRLDEQGDVYCFLPWVLGFLYDMGMQIQTPTELLVSAECPDPRFADARGF